MTRGLSKEQLALAAVYTLGLALTLVAVILDLWRLAAVTAVVSLGLFSALVILTLAAMTHAAGSARHRINEVLQEIRSARTLRTLRRLDDRQARLDKQLSAAEARREASEQRLLATFEAHRIHLEDEVAQLRDELKKR